jgi:hypothetical protein
MTEFISGFRSIPDDELQPPKQSFEPSRLHQVPLHVVIHQEGNPQDPPIITLRGAKLLQGMCTIPKGTELLAKELAANEDITTAAHAQLSIAEEGGTYTRGYSLRHVRGTLLPEMADFVRHPTIEKHSLPLELHAYSNLVEYLDQLPGRELDAAYLKAFGKYVLSRA